MHHPSVPWEIRLLYFLAETLFDFYKRSPPKCKIPDFWNLKALVKFHQICTLIGYFCWKCIKFQLKKVWTSCVSWYQRVVQNLKRNLVFVSKMTRIWWILIRALKSLKNLHFDWSLLCKVYNVWPKKVQRSYISWHWRAMQNLKKNWLVIWKMTWGIWQIFIRILENVKISIFMGFFCPK